MRIDRIPKQTPLQRIQEIGGQIETKKRLEGLNVCRITKEQALEAWTKVQEMYGGNECVSNCCGADIIGEVMDGTARCPECKEMCSVERA
jgi:hypothetical protein